MKAEFMKSMFSCALTQSPHVFHCSVRGLLYNELTDVVLKKRKQLFCSD